MTEDELKSLIIALQAEVQRLSVPYEDALSDRVFTGAKKKLFTSFGGWVAVATLFAGFVGWDEYKVVREKISTSIVEELKPQIVKQVQEKVQEEIKKELQVILQRQRTAIEKDMADAINKTQKDSVQNMNTVIGEIGKNVPNKNFVQNTEKSIKDLTIKNNLDGWSFFGSKDEKGVWKNTAFSKDKEPNKGDKITATTNVFLRIDKPTYDPNKDPQWTYPAFKTVVSSGEQVTVQQVESIKTEKGESIWVLITRNNPMGSK